MSKSPENGVHKTAAICGYAFRFPGEVNDANSLWKVLESKKSVTEKLDGRWGPQWQSSNLDAERVPGTWRASRFGIVKDNDAFDASFFNINENEAKCMDRQQRQFLELTVEALHQAGIPLLSLRDSDTGVWVGCSTMETLAATRANASAFRPLSNPGFAQCVIANRVSLFLGCTGPSMAVDTACASTLTVLESAVSAINTGRCDIAIIGGTNPLLIPETTVGYEEMGVLSPDGICKAFDLRANGYARAEGYGVIVLRSLDTALSNGNPVQAIIRGVRNSHCGNSSGGLTKPSRSAQAQLIHDTWRDAGLNPKDVDFVEAHGTGTPVGDAEEGSAIAAAFGSTSRKVPMASSKATFGHMEPAAACVSLIKACLMIEKKQLLPQAAWSNGNPEIDWSKVEVPTTMRSFKSSNSENGKITIGINAFGFGGSNSHCIVQEYSYAVSPVNQIENDKNGWCFGGQRGARTICIPFSAASIPALTSLLQNWSSTANIPESSAADVMNWLVRHRSHLQNRACVIASSGTQFSAEALSFANGELTSARVVSGKPASKIPASGSGGSWRMLKPASVVVVFAGQGQQHIDMGRELYVTFDDFRATINECDKYYAEITGTSFINSFGFFVERSANDDNSEDLDVNEPRISVPSICFFQCALYRTLRRLGVQVRAVVGHSLGELAAAYATGRASLRATIRAATTRAMVQQRRHCGKGGMIAVAASRETVESICKARGLNELWVAAVNSEQSITMAGHKGQCAKLKELCKNVYKLRAAVLRTAVAYHSPYVADAQDELLRGFSDALNVPTDQSIEKEKSCRWFSTVTGLEVKSDHVTPQSLWENVRQPVAFENGLAAALSSASETEDVDTIIEIAARPTLGANISQVASGIFKKDSPALYSTGVDTKNTNLNEVEAFLAVVGGLYVSGALDDECFDWSRVNGGTGITKATPPPFRIAWAPLDVAFRRDGKHWDLMAYLPTSAVEQRQDFIDPFLRQGGRLCSITFPWLKDHVVAGNAIVPATGMLEYVLETVGNSRVLLEDVSVRAALPVPPDDGSIEWSVDTTAEDGRVAVISGKGEVVITHCTVRVKRLPEKYEAVTPASTFLGQKTWTETVLSLEKNNNSKGCYVRMDKSMIYARCKAMGFEYGKQFARCTDCFVGDDVAYSFVDASNCQEGGGYRFHPAVFDATFHAALIVLGVWSTQVVPVGVGSIEFIEEYDGTSDLAVETTVTARPSVAHCFCDIIVSYTNDVTKPVVVFRDIELAPLTKPPPVDSDLLNDGSLLEFVSQSVETSEFDLSAVSDAFRTAATNAIDLGQVELLNLSRHRLKARIAASCRDALSKINETNQLNGSSRGYLECIQRLAACSDEKPESFEELEASMPYFATEIQITRSILTRVLDIVFDTNAVGALIYQPEHLPTFFDRSLSVDAVYDGVASLVKNAVDQIAEHQPVIRVLEIGLRFGGLASRVAGNLKEYGDRCQYVATDLASTFLPDADEILDSRQLQKVHTARFDIEQSPESQSLDLSSFDVVIIMSTLHGVVDSATGLANALKLAKPGALIVNVEPTQSDFWWLMELWFGSMEVWWRFKDWRSNILTSIGRPYSSCWCDQRAWIQLFNHAPDLEVCTDLPVETSPLFSTLVCRKRRLQSTMKKQVPTINDNNDPRYNLDPIRKAVIKAFNNRSSSSLILPEAQTIVVDACGDANFVRLVRASLPLVTSTLASTLLLHECYESFINDPAQCLNDVVNKSQERIRETVPAEVASSFCSIPSMRTLLGGGLMKQASNGNTNVRSTNQFAVAPTTFSRLEGRNIILCVDADNDRLYNQAQGAFLELGKVILNHYDQNASSLIVVVYRDASKIESRYRAAFFRGLLRPFAAEHTSCRILCAIIDTACDQGLAIRTLAQHLIGNSGMEPEIEIDASGLVIVPRLMRFEEGFGLGGMAQSTAISTSQLKVSHEMAVVAEADGTGRTDGIELRQRRLAPSQDTVEILVEAAALNFKDVMSTLGMLDKLGVGTTGGLGFGCFGRITSNDYENDSETKDAVQLQPGSLVVALASGCVATKVRCNLDLVATVPLHGPAANVSLHGWACITMYATAYDALVLRSNVKHGDVVLIHSAASAVGQAALHLAVRLGARCVFATAGTEDKRRWLSLRYGALYPDVFAADAVGNSRNTSEYEKTISDALATRGLSAVNVILSSLSGVLNLTTGFKLLAPSGHFVDIAKRDMLDNNPMPMAGLLKNITYSSCQLDLLADANPRAARKVLESVVEAFNSGLFYEGDIATKRVPFEGAAIGAAVKEASAGDTYAKAVVDIGSWSYRDSPKVAPLLPGHDGGTYVIVGGLGGIGLCVAEILSIRGASRVVLVGRRSTSSIGRQELNRLNAISGGRCQVAVRSCDATNADAVRKLLDEFKSTLKGIIHLACVLCDKNIMDMSIADLMVPVKSKAVAALNLHRASLNIPQLEHFVIATSGQDLLGEGQGNYVAANQMAVDLCRARFEQGLPGLAVGLGPVIGAGMVERDPAVAKILQSIGIDFISVQEAAASLVVSSEKPYILAARINGILIDKALDPGKGQRLKWEHLVLPPRATSTGPDAGASDEERIALARKKLAAVFSRSPDEIETDVPLMNYGVDSLLGTELVNIIKRDLGANLSFTDILTGASIESILGIQTSA